MPGVDRDLLHDYLWDKADRRGAVDIRAGQLAEALGISKFTMSRIVHEFLQEGRLREIGRGYRNTRAYTVCDPEVWRERQEATMDGRTAQLVDTAGDDEVLDPDTETSPSLDVGPSELVEVAAAETPEVEPEVGNA